MQNKLELKLSQSMSSVFYDMQESVFGEVASIRNQTSQIKVLLEDAIASLHAAFESIHTSTGEQMTTMSALMMQGGESEGNKTIFQKVDSTNVILTELFESLLLNSKNNLQALKGMDNVRNRLKRLPAMAKEGENILAQLYACGEADAVSGQTVRKLVEQLQKQQEKQAVYINETIKLFKQTHKLINKSASRDMDEVYASKAEVENILQFFFHMYTSLADSRTKVNQVNADIRQHLGTAIRALQFEDISRQSLGYTDLHLDRMEGVLSILTDGLKTLEQSDLDIEAYTERVAAIHVMMMDYYHGLQLEEKNPISQENMDEGDIDLF